MTFSRKTLLATALFAALPIVQAEDDQFRANVAITTDYVWRGMTQTDEKVAVQGGFDMNHESGLLVGIWGSNVKFLEDNTVAPEDRADLEIDLYVGYNGDLGNGIGYGFKAGRFLYPGAGTDLNYDMTEFQLSLSYSLPQGTELGLAYDYSPNLSGGVDKAHHLVLSAGHTLANGIGFGGHVGRQAFSDNDKAGDDYTYYGASLSFPIGEFDGSIAYSNTDKDNAKDVADDRIFFTIRKDF
ncbi:TorF family putative porin [Candidatus Parabeggiatoa sp. HSG14]|uniref:TorF family putative porin n=1 Tax=Candidatus Parabeggiatoa sp. HSG14 TaxID=3055593 RepID=UPI0025A7226D|nr:TorF family putative porin [Thiotrichales bacterium HSG14]